MQELTQLAGILKSNEVRLIRRYYRTQAIERELPRLELFDLVRKKKVKTDSEAAFLIYKGKPNSAFSHLKKRLKQDIINLMMLQDNSKKLGNASDKARFESRRQLIEGSVLISRGAHKVGERILKKAAGLAAKYELPAEGFLIADLLRSHWGWRKGLVEYNKYEDEIHASVEMQQAIFKAKEYYHKIILPNQFQKNIESDLELVASVAVDELKPLYEKTGSARVGYYYYFIAIYLLHFRNQFKESLEYAEKLLELVETEPSVFLVSRIAACKNQLAFIHLNLKEFKKAAGYAANAVNIYNEGTINHLSALEVKFCASLNHRDFDDCLQILETVKEHPRLTMNNITEAKWEFYLAGYEFSIGHFAEAYEILSQSTKLSQDRGGWLMGHKMLEILCQVSLGEIDTIDFRLDSLQKLFQRQNTRDLVRIKLIKKVLKSIVRERGDFGKVAIIEKGSLDLLSEAEGQYAYDPMGYEFVRFDQWFVARLQKEALKV